MKNDDWVLVEDGLPKHDQEVITYYGGMPSTMPNVLKMGITRYTIEIEGKRAGYFYGGSPGGYQVTHWMPLIASPIKEVKNEKR